MKRIGPFGIALAVGWFFFTGYANYAAQISGSDSGTQKKPESNRSTAILEQCLVSGVAKVDLQQKCIGLVTKRCTKTLRDTPDLNELDCFDREAEAWYQIFEKYKLAIRHQLEFSDADARSAFEAYIARAESADDPGCAFETARWPENAKLRLIDNFRCNRDLSAVSAITVFVWSDEFRRVNGG